MSRADGTKAGPSAKRAGDSGESGKADRERPESQERRGVRRGERSSVSRGKIGEGLGNLSHSLPTADPSRSPSGPFLVRSIPPKIQREKCPRGPAIQATGGRAPGGSVADDAWPFKRIDRAAVMALSAIDLQHFEAVVVSTLSLLPGFGAACDEAAARRPTLRLVYTRRD